MMYQIVYLGRKVEDYEGERHHELIAINLIEKSGLYLVKVGFTIQILLHVFYMFYIKLVQLYAWTVLKGMYKMNIPGSSYEHCLQSQMAKVWTPVLPLTSWLVDWPVCAPIFSSVKEEQ